MSHNKYIMKEEEIQILLTGLIVNGVEDTYDRMKVKALMMMDQKPDVDEILLDMSETLHKKVQNELANENKDLSIINAYNTLSFMLKRLAHKVYRKYNREGEQRDNNRFLRLISCNKDISLII